MGTKKGGKPSIGVEPARRVVAAMRWLKETEYKNDTQLGKALKRTQPAITEILNGNSEPSYETADRVAGLLGIEPGDLLAGRWSPEGKQEPADPYPSRALAIQAARLLGVSEAAIVAVRSTSLLPGAKDPGQRFWYGKIERVDAELRDTGPSADIAEAASEVSAGADQIDEKTKRKAEAPSPQPARAGHLKPTRPRA